MAQYLRLAIALFRKRHGRPPGPYWHSIPRSGIHALLRLAQGQWPPAPRVTCAADAVRFTICGEYETWLREERGPGRRAPEGDVLTSRISATGAASLSHSLQPVTANARGTLTLSLLREGSTPCDRDAVGVGLRELGLAFRTRTSERLRNLQRGPPSVPFLI